MFLKICGITRADDAMHAVEQGATAIGFVFWRQSPRCVTPESAARIAALLPPHVARVGVFVNEAIETVRDLAARVPLTLVQLHGDEPPDYASRLPCPLLRSTTLEEAGAACTLWPPDTLLLVDAGDPVRRGGTGRTVDWDRAAHLARQRPIVLAGGLTPMNVAAAIATVQPFGVDVSSGVERAPGIKDAVKVTTFLRNARAAFERGAHAGSQR